MNEPCPSSYEGSLYHGKVPCVLTKGHGAAHVAGDGYLGWWDSEPLPLPALAATTKEEP